MIALGAWATWWKAFKPILTVAAPTWWSPRRRPRRSRQIGWTGGEAVRDFRSSIHYLRTTPDGRIAFGLGGLQPDLARRIDPRYAYDERFGAPRRARTSSRMFPAFARRADRGRRGAARST